MSEEGSRILSSPENVENTENGAIQNDDETRPALQSDELTEKVAKVDSRGNRPTEPAQPEEPNRPALGSSEAVDSNPSEMQPSTPDVSNESKSSERASDDDQPTAKSVSSDVFTEAKSLEQTGDANQPATKSNLYSERTSDADQATAQSILFDVFAEAESSKKLGDANQPATKSTPSDGMSPSKSTSDLEEVTESIQLIYKGLKNMKISGQDSTESASGKKVRKTPSTPRAKSTPVYLTSPPLTRSRSRDLRKCPTTPASPTRSGSRNGESESEEVKGTRGRQRAKKN